MHQLSCILALQHVQQESRLFLIKCHSWTSSPLLHRPQNTTVCESATRWWSGLENKRAQMSQVGARNRRTPSSLYQSWHIWMLLLTIFWRSSTATVQLLVVHSTVAAEHRATMHYWVWPVSTLRVWKSVQQVCCSRGAGLWQWLTYYRILQPDILTRSLCNTTCMWRVSAWF